MTTTRKARSKRSDANRVMDAVRSALRCEKVNEFERKCNFAGLRLPHSHDGSATDRQYAQAARLEVRPASLRSPFGCSRFFPLSVRSAKVDCPAPIRSLPLLRHFSVTPRTALYAPTTPCSRWEVSRTQFGLARRRGFASTPIAATAVTEPTLEELAQRALEEENATQVLAVAPPPPDVLPASETLLDAANVDYLSLSGTLDLSSLPGSYGFHPIMRMQSMFLHLHESFPLLGHGLPWYILIPTVTICLRLLLFTFQVRAQSNAARMAIIQPQMLAGMEKLKAAKARGDFMGAQTAQIETQTLMRDNNVNPIKNLAFPLAQATVFMTMFFALKGLAGAEIPSMTTEGLAWMTNLTLPDPYWVLPVASTALTLATLEVSFSFLLSYLSLLTRVFAQLGVDSTTQVQTSTTKNMKLFFRVMLVVALPFIAYFPAVSRIDPHLSSHTDSLCTGSPSLLGHQQLHLAPPIAPPQATRRPSNFRNPNDPAENPTRRKRLCTGAFLLGSVQECPDWNLGKMGTNEGGRREGSSA